MSTSSEDVAWRAGVFDAHCHPTDVMASINDIAEMQARVLTVMSTRRQDQHLVAEAASRYPLTRQEDLARQCSKVVIPAFGWHPWFSYQMYDDRVSGTGIIAIEHYKAVLRPESEDEEFLQSLPPPVSLSDYLDDVSRRLEEFPYALVGEIGLDRAFRLPKTEFKGPADLSVKTGGSDEDYTPGSREGRPLSPQRVHLDHQKLVLRAQLELAGKYQRPVSVHSVQTHGAVFDLLQELWRGHERPSKRQRQRRQSAANAQSEEAEAATSLSAKPFPPRICMHSYSGPPDALKQFLASTVPADVYFSFSILVNFSTPAAKKAEQVIKALPDDRILVESDLHCAGERMDGLLMQIVLKVCELKAWSLEEGAQKLRDNYERFVFG
jgi:Tat protein secretion system quality control protein TatD with DNase activity